MTDANHEDLFVVVDGIIFHLELNKIKELHNVLMFLLASQFTNYFH